MQTSKIKVLIATYYWPPSGGSGVQRWLKFVKYLRNFDIEPVVYTVKDPNYAQQDTSLLKDIPEGVEVIRQPIFEPNNFLLKKSDKKKKEVAFQNPSPSLGGKILQYIRINCFVPDARKFWIKPSVKFLKKYLSENHIDVVITTGPPHSLHLIGLGLKKKLNIKWIADFRDPWTDIYYNSSFKMSDRTMKKHQKLEMDVLEQSDHVITTNFVLNDLFSKRTKTPVSLITNGYDDEATKTDDSQRNEGFSLDYIGYLPQESDPIALWKAVSELCEEDTDFKKDVRINLTGDINRVVLKSIRDFSLEEFTTVKGYVSHDEAVQMQHAANVLLILIAKSKESRQITPGKIFECLQAKRPILTVGPTDGGAANILNDTKAGKIFDYEDSDGIKKHIFSLYKQYKQGKLVVNSENIDRYHRKELTKTLATVINKTLSQK
jgi:hypothetical protein